MDTNQQKTKCNKCKRNFTSEILDDKKELICTNCKNKTKQKFIIIGLVSLCLIGGIIVFVSSNKFKQQNVVSFEGVGSVTDTISVSVQDALNFKMDELTASKAIVDGISSSIDNIESFKRVMDNEISNAKNNKTTSIGIPSISFFFDKNSSTISQKGKELISEFEKYYLQTNQNAIIEIAGYACDLGTNDFNNILSQDRAEMVKEFLIKNNIPANRIETKWYGKSKNNLFKHNTIEKYRKVIISIKNS